MNWGYATGLFAMFLGCLLGLADPEPQRAHIVALCFFVTLFIFFFGYTFGQIISELKKIREKL